MLENIHKITDEKCNNKSGPNHPNSKTKKNWMTIQV